MPDHRFIHRTAQQRSLRRVLFIAIWIVALAAPLGSIGYLLFVNPLNPLNPLNVLKEPVESPGAGLYWDAAQMEIAYDRFENQMLMYRSGVDADYPKLLDRYRTLLAKLDALADVSRGQTTQPALLARQQGEIDTLGQMLDRFAAPLDAMQRDPSRADPLIATLRDNWADVDALASDRRFVDVADRAALNRDFDSKRRILSIAGLLLTVLSAAAALLLALNGRGRSRLIRQQRAALDAEHQASRAAREASLAKDAFLGMVSHELRTPLHAIVSSIELLNLNLHAEADRKVIRRLDAGARQLEAQMRDLTDYARLGAGKLELRHEVFEPRELLASIVDEHSPAARARGLSLESVCSGSAGLVESDPHRIRQIVNNLVTNAIRYTESGSVRVQMEQQRNALIVVVRDTGPGLSRDQIPRIFQEFTQLDAPHARRTDGAGMGLAIVQGLLGLFGGSVAVESKMGEGTAFTVTIPVTTAPVAEIRATDAPDGPRARVLIIDDDAPVRASLSEMITHMGSDAVAFSDTDTALAWLNANQCDVVLVDLHMPKRDGIGFVAAFRERVDATSVPVIAISADSPDPLTEGGKGARSANPFFERLVKPVHYDELCYVVMRALAVRVA
ncbi:ATP-binding protein [Paraburkholderia sp.]|uniref:ATP-binding response regulator n=1 Tax=Paraburkholderia sp. TaxID=1926495 RepID=UPI0023992297|nr:ATP-binding protein [Paraburkholderia sp.]MDE1182501.1 ATP-binding protein [Paraburkholderia sp.]